MSNVGYLILAENANSNFDGKLQIILVPSKKISTTI